MNPSTYYALPPLIRQLERLAGDYRVFSFDVFDTLLVRRLHEPDLLKGAVDRYLVERAAGVGLTLLPSQVREARDQAEARERLRHGQQHPDFEARYPDFMGAALRHLFGDRLPPRLLADVTTYELDLESATLVVRAPWPTLLHRLRDQGKTLIALSDMYHPSTHIRHLLDRAGLAPLLHHIRSSADDIRAKASGAGYAALIEQFGWSPAEWVHVGDNPFSDGARPASIGIRALVLRDASEKKRKAVGRRYWNAAVSRIYWRGRCQQQLMMPLEGEVQDRDALYRTGYEFVGPLLCGFIQHVAERTRRLGIPRIYFLAREGQMFMRLWDQLQPHLHPTGQAPSVGYLHVSRLALAPAACAQVGLTPDLAHIAFLPPGNRDLRDLTRVFGLPLEPLLPLARRHGLEADTPLSPHHAGWKTSHEESLEELLADPEFQRTVKAVAADAGEALQRYLADEGFFSQRDVALVDIGWLGTIQRFLHLATGGRSDRPRLHGLLFAATRGVPYPTTPDNYLEGWFYDGQRLSLAASMVTYCLELFEECCRADQPGLMAYERTTDGYRLRHRAADDPAFVSERQQSAFYRPLQQGVLAAAARFGPATALTGYAADDLRPWLAQLAVARLGFPRTREVADLRFHYHLNDFDAGHRPLPAVARQMKRRLWSEPLWRLRLPGLRSYYAARHLLTLLAKA